MKTRTMLSADAREAFKDFGLSPIEGASVIIAAAATTDKLLQEGKARAFARLVDDAKARHPDLNAWALLHHLDTAS